MALNFPSSPTDGQIYTLGDRTWKYFAVPGAWQVQTTIVQGPIGYTGSRGESGSVGYTGSQGTNGIDGEPGTITLVCPGDVSTTTSSMSNVTGLEIELEPGTYAFDVALRVSSSTTAGCRFNVSFTGTVTDISYLYQGNTNATAWGANVAVTTNNATSVTILGTTANAQCACRMTGTVTVSTSGTLAARKVKITSGTLTIAGGFMNVYKVS